jgi:hypothetical protein
MCIPPSPSFPPQFQAGPVLPLSLVLLKKRGKYNNEGKVFLLAELRTAIQKYSFYSFFKDRISLCSTDWSQTCKFPAITSMCHNDACFECFTILVNIYKLTGFRQSCGNNFSIINMKCAWHLWLTPIILASEEAKIRGIMVRKWAWAKWWLRP